MITFRKECVDCKYCDDFYCTHEHAQYCEDSSLWTPNWYVDEKYKKAYECAIREFAEYLRKESFLCDSNEWHSFQAIDVDVLDDLAKDFLRGK